MRENFVQSMARQVKAQTHEESKFWRASQPLPNKSSMQGRESEKKSNIQQFHMAMRNIRKACEIFAKHAKYSQSMRNIRKACEMPKKSTTCRTESKDVKNEFCILCEISQALRISSCVIFRYFCTDSVRFLSQDIV